MKARSSDAVIAGDERWKASPTETGITTVLANIKKSHWTPASVVVTGEATRTDCNVCSFLLRGQVFLTLTHSRSICSAEFATRACPELKLISRPCLLFGTVSFYAQDSFYGSDTFLGACVCFLLFLDQAYRHAERPHVLPTNACVER